MMIHKDLCANRSWRFFRGNASAARADAVQVSDAREPWDPMYDDSGWETVTLPHTVRNECYMCSGGRNYQGIAWYRRRFTVTPSEASADLFFEFEGAMQRIDVWLDGEPLGWREGGFLPIGFDLTGRLTPDTIHTMAVRITNEDMPDVPPGKPQGALDFCYFGGLYRDAWLHVRNKLRFTSALFEGSPAGGGLFIKYSDVSARSARVSVRAEAVNHFASARSCFIRISLDGTQYAETDTVCIRAGEKHTFSVEFAVPDPQLWSPDSPYLYTLKAELITSNGSAADIYNERIGIRDISFTPDGCYINGKKTFLNGANRHQEYLYVGFAITDTLQYRDVKKLRDAGINCVRTAHYPQDRAFMDACDELGIICVMPTPGWQIHPNSAKFDLLSYENTRRMIRRDRNRPSACLWEPILNETDYPEYFAKKQLEIVYEETDGLGFAACDSHYAYKEHYPVNYGMRQTEGKAFFIREYGDSYIEQFGPMSTMRRVRRGEDTGFYPGGEKAMIRMAEERFESWLMLYMNDKLSGCAMWAGIDHNRGYEENEGAVGMLDLARIPKFNYYLQSCQQPHEKAGAMVYIANYNTASSPRDITVYSNAEKVRLLQNGREIAVLTAEEGWRNTEILTKPHPGRAMTMIDNASVFPGSHPPFTFKNVAFEKGELRAEAIIGNEVRAVHTRITPEEACRIELEPDTASYDIWTADGSDLLLVRAAIKDKNGTVVPVSGINIRFRIHGDADTVGDGEKWVSSNPCASEAGYAYALLRAGTRAGQIILEAEAPGLTGASVALRTEKDTLPLLRGPFEKKTRRKMYPCDSLERFSVRQSLKLEEFYHWDMGTGKPASASSCAEGYPASNAVQGRISEPWVASGTSLPQWWQADMQETCMVYGTTIHFMDDGIWYDYDVLTSDDGSAWTLQASGRASGQSLLPDRFSSPVKARFVRVAVRGVSADTPIGIYQVEIHGDPA